MRGGGLPRLSWPGFADIRGYQAMYRDFARAIATGAAPEMSLERAIEDQQLMTTLPGRMYAERTRKRQPQ